MSPESAGCCARSSSLDSWSPAAGERWSTGRRLIYFLASPLIPAILVSRLIGVWRRTNARESLPWGTLPLIILGAVAKGAGELLGSVVGTPRIAVTGMNEIEVHKARFGGRTAS